MQVWPAIDLRGGKCVRLQQGDYARETVFGADPAAMARHWVELGAKRLHLVDLDGARYGQQANLASVRGHSRRRERPLPVGWRHSRRGDRSVTLLDLGLSRLVVGTRRCASRPGFAAACRQFPGRLALGIDARHGRVATDGWLADQRRRGDRIGAAVCRRAAGGDHLHRYRHRRHAGRAERRGHAADDPGRRCSRHRLRRRNDRARRGAAGRAGAAGCIIGRALYEDRLTLVHALAAAGDEE